MNRIRKLRQDLALSQAQLAELANTSAPQIHRLEQDVRKLTKEWAERLAPHLKVEPVDLLFGNNVRSTIADVGLLKVVGTAEAGAFRDISLIDEVHESELPTITVVKDTRFQHAQQYALRLVGDSMNLVYPDGCFIACARWSDTGLALGPGMRLHVERYNGPLVETTVKEYVVRDGVGLLTPRSSNSAHKEIELNGDESTEIVVKGLVIGSFVPEPIF